jgi:hypothetical protein
MVVRWQTGTTRIPLAALTPITIKIKKMEKTEQQGIELRIKELEKELNIILNEPARLYTKYKGQKITRIKRDIEIYKKRLERY